MDTIETYLSEIADPQQKQRMKEIFQWIQQAFPNLEYRYAWNQPMFTDHGTFIIGFSIAKQHVAVSPEKAGMIHFFEEIKQAGYGQSKMLFRIKWDETVDYEVLKRILTFNIEDKQNCTNFWRK